MKLGQKEQASFLTLGWGVTADLEIKYVFVNNYEAFEKWLEDIYTRDNGDGIIYRELVNVSFDKISDNVTVLN